ncbi:MAG: PadR family transcriptional regulator [Bacteroidetes bacterium]|nr:PadR family transcriptional regulator [Bacteroidota bacterium]
MNEEFIPKWKSQVKKGILSLVVLRVLSKGECYGYELIEEIRKYTMIDIAEGTLYPLLIRLKEDNLVTSKWVEQTSGIPRKYYCLTEEGIASLKEMKSYWDSLNNSIQKMNDNE